MRKYYSLLAFLAFSILSVRAQTQDNPSIQQAIPFRLFPSNNIWNTAIDKLPVDANSASYIQTIGAGINLHPDFGSGNYNGNPIGIPYVLVSGNQKKVTVTFQYSDESDPGPYPIPPNPPIEGGNDTTGDCHVLVVDTTNYILYETWSTHPNADGSWRAGSGAIFDLKSNNLRPDGWTSSDAAGLPVLPGLVRWDEVASGVINHAIRLTVPKTRNTYVWPARHKASTLTGTNYPPMGQRFRLKSTFNISGFSPNMQVILNALKKYGIILADNGSPWYITGAPDSNWNNNDLNTLKTIHGSDFEAVDCSSLMINSNSAEAKQAPNDVQYENSPENIVNVFPNPFQSELNIEIAKPEIVSSIEIINTLGESVIISITSANNNFNSIYFNGNSLASGVFFLKINLVNNTIIKKIVHY